jgi:hypothetical protein
MTTVIKILKTRFSRRHHVQIDERLASDLGVSRIVVEFCGS